jgi:signal transduction histidine kinase
LFRFFPATPILHPMPDTYDDPTLRMVVAAGTAHDVRQFWCTVADILLHSTRADQVVIEYSDHWGAGAVRVGAAARDAPTHTETWQEGEDRYACLRLVPGVRDPAALKTLLFNAVGLASLVGRRTVLEHERRLGTFLVELSRWMRTAAADPHQLLQYTVHSVMSLVGAHGAFVVERTADGALHIGVAVGAIDGFATSPAALKDSVFERVMNASAPLLADRLSEHDDVPVKEPATRDALAAAMIVPLPTTGDAAGVLAVHRLRHLPRGEERFTLQDVATLQAVASHIGGALELAWAIRAARQAARRASAMVNGSPLPLALLTRNGRVIEANRALATLFGFDDPERIRDQHLDAFPMTLDRATPIEALDLAASGVPWRGRAEVIRGSEERKCEAFFTPLDNADAEFLLAIHDRTEEIRTRRELVAREKLSTVGTLAAGVAHEVNNPLAAIRMEAELLGMQSPAPEVAAASAAIIREVDRAARIAKSLLRLATQAHGRMEETNVGQLVTDLVDVRGPLLREVGIDLRVRVPENLPSVLSRGGDVEQILLNVLSNAEDAVRGRGNPVVELTVERHEDDVRICVNDSGPGVDPSIRTRIFDPFFTSKPPDQASGLGLAMCHRITSELGGRIWVEDGPLGGARFVIDLPVSAR